MGLSVTLTDSAWINSLRILEPGTAWAQVDSRTRSAAELIPLSGTVSIQCDDGAYSNYVLAESLAARNVPASFAVVTSYVNTGHPTYMNSSDLLKLVEMGHSVLDHSTNHNPQIGLLPEEEREAELAASRSALQSWGVNPFVWVAPGGAGFANWWGLMREAVSKFYPMAVMSNGWNNANPSVGIDSVDIYAIGAYPPYPNLSWSVANTKTETARKLARNEWVILKFHGTPDSVITKMLVLVDWLREKGVSIVPLETQALLWYNDDFEIYQDIFLDPQFERDLDENGIPDNCILLGQPNYLVTDAKYGLTPAGGSRYLVVTGYACQFDVGGIARDTPYSMSFWAKATQPVGATVRCRIYQLKHGEVSANGSGYQQIQFNLPDSSWYRIDSLRVPESIFLTNDSTETLRLVFSSYGNPDSGVCIAGPSLVPLVGAPPSAPRTFELRCFPNPSRGSTLLSYELPDECDVTLQVFDVSGHLIDEMVEGRLSAGPHFEIWPGQTLDGKRAASGVYLCRVKAGPFETSEKVILLR
jgi:peptidoglycan/xylan/chitin deacetylase (PgdA/CDA1 family)